ncbi:MAG: uracil-DNA glycosylase [Gammaproteobacteria bacterium]
MSIESIKLEPSWKSWLMPEFSKPYMQSLRAFLQTEKKAGKIIYPRFNQIFRAFDLTPFEALKVVILGQDPYHAPNQAEGLCFSVPKGIPRPPSLENIYHELERDLAEKNKADATGFKTRTGSLEHWAKQGVLLLNSVLTVEAHQAASHQKQGWEVFTDAVISLINTQLNGIVFLLWGSYAQKKGAVIDSKKHLVLNAPHPSPLSAYRGFIGCGHFSKTNDYLIKQNKDPIAW